MATTGYKIVAADGSPLCGTQNVMYRVGERYDLSNRKPLKLREQGFHFCTVALNCLGAVGWNDGWRLLRVSVPVGTETQSDGSGDVVARSIVVDADVTDDAATLLTGMTRVGGQDYVETCWYEGGLSHRDVDDEPAVVMRWTEFDTDCVRKFWHRRGASVCVVAGGTVSETLYKRSEAGGERIFTYVNATLLGIVEPHNSRWHQLYDVATRREPWENDAPVTAS
jgi:hypothetical protein